MNKKVSEQFKDIKDIYLLQCICTEQDEEIERLKELCDKYEEEHKTTFETWQKDIKENEHLRTALNSKESIIKEVREYIEDKIIDIDTHNVYGEIERLDLEEIKRILDKEKNNV